MEYNIESLKEMIKDRDSQKRFLAVKELRKLKDCKVKDMLFQVYGNPNEHGGIRDSACTGIWEIDPEWLPRIRGIELARRYADILEDIFEKKKETDGILKRMADGIRVRIIGMRLHLAGGFDLMAITHGLFTRKHLQDDRNLEVAWNGIGRWNAGVD
jgi:hypothetical protein